MRDGGGPPDARAALARKYATLVALRRRRDAGGDAAGGGALRALAAEFPGCLRELDTLGLPELERRAHACADDADADEPWIAWIAAYHALMRAALAIRAPAGRDAATLVSVATQAAAVPIDEAFVASVLEPPEGRVAVVVLRALSARFGVPAATIAATLFPTRRPSPYTL
jgi:hypothetical protein